MSKINLRLAIPLQCLIFSLAMVLAFPGTYAKEKSLRSISCVEVLMASGKNFLELAHATKDQFQGYAELTLRQYGVRVGDCEEYAHLWIQIQAIKPGPYVFMVGAEVYRSVELAYIPKAKNEDDQRFPAPVYTNFVYGSVSPYDSLREHVRNSMDELVEVFVNDLLAVNPIR